MPTKVSELLVQVDRAAKHLADLNSARALFMVSHPWDIDHKDNPQTGERTFHLVVKKPVPIELSALMGDVLQNLRSALDHLAWHLVQSSLVTPKARDKDIYFPIFPTQ